MTFWLDLYASSTFLLLMNIIGSKIIGKVANKPTTTGVAFVKLLKHKRMEVKTIMHTPIVLKDEAARGYWRVSVARSIAR